MLRPISTCWPPRMKCDSMRRARPPSSSGVRAPTASSGMWSTSRDRPADHRRGRAAGDVLGRAIERQDPAGVVRGRQPARQAVDDVLIERLQVGDLVGRLLEPRPGRPDAIGERSAEQRDREEPERVEEVGVLRDRPRRQHRRHQPGIVHVAGGREVLRQHHAAVQHRAQRRHQEAAAPELHHRRRHDRQDVERREIAGDAAREVDERRDDQRVAGQLHVDDPPAAFGQPQRRRVERRQRVGEADQEEERVDRKRPGRGDLGERRRPQQRGADDGADGDQPPELPPQVARGRLVSSTTSAC